MHATHGFLINTSELTLLDDRALTVEAENYLDNYENDAWDYYSPLSVIREPEAMVDKMKTLLEWQERFADGLRSKLLTEHPELTVKDLLDTDFGQKIDKNVWHLPEEESSEYYHRQYSIAWRLSEWLRYAQGYYTFDSHFYDCEMQTAFVKPAIKRVQEHPEDYALVLFDLHF